MNTLNVYRKWNIGSWVRNKLADVSSNVFPVVAPENTKGDMIVYRRSSYERDFSHMGYYLDSATIEVVVISDSYDRAAEIAEKVDDALSGTFREEGGRLTINLAGGYEDFQDGKYYNILQFKIS